MTGPDARVSACAQLATLDLARHSLSHVATRVAELARLLVTPAVDASVTVVDSRRACTLGFAGALATVLDERQYPPWYGPGMTALATGHPLDIRDVRADEGHVDFCRQAARHGITSTYSVPVPIGHDALAALTVYTSGAPLEGPCRDVVAEIAACSAATLGNALVYGAALELADQMRNAMASRAVIEQAKGMLMAEHQCSADAAFELLRASSTRSNRKLRDVARSIVLNATRRSVDVRAR